MNLSSSQLTARRKAVWGPKRPLIASLLVVVSFGFTPDATAKGRHIRIAPTAEAGVPGAQVKGYKLDTELTTRSRRNWSQTTRVIVTLQPGAELPAEYQRFAKR